MGRTESLSEQESPPVFRRAIYGILNRDSGSSVDDVKGFCSKGQLRSKITTPPTPLPVSQLLQYQSWERERRRAFTHNASAESCRLFRDTNRLAAFLKIYRSRRLTTRSDVVRRELVEGEEKSTSSSSWTAIIWINHPSGHKSLSRASHRPNARRTSTSC